MLNKIKGGLFGLAIGDALGGTTEFMTPEEIKKKHGKVTEIIGGGVWDLEVGETTDDTAMTIAVAKGLIANPQDPIEEIGKYFLLWEETDPKDIGVTIRTVFHYYQSDWFEAAQKAHQILGGKSAGNGSLMRCLPIAFAYSGLAKIEEISALQSKITHHSDLASEAASYRKITAPLLNTAL